MKLSTLFIFCLVFSLSATVYAQKKKISINERNTTILNVLKTIENNSEFVFFFNDNQIDVTQQIDINVKDATLAEVLNQLLTPANYNYKIIDRQVLITKAKTKAKEAGLIAQQDNKKITGTIVDSKGLPIIGANVVEEGTTNGTITDLDGKFILTLKKGANLLISYIGYSEQKIATAGKSSLQIILKEDSELLDEVVVVGYGTMKKSDLTGTVVHADLDKIQSSSNVSLGESLQGAIAGFNVGAVTQAGQDPSMSIRGRTSISGSNSPLIVLDGIIFHGSMVDINPNDIQSVDVLKDASATAIYGSQASNGVVLITTKQGTKMSKPIIEYNGTIGISEMTNDEMLPEDASGFVRKISDAHLDISRTGDDLKQINPAFDVSKYFMDRNSMEGYQAGVDTNWWDLLTRDTPYVQSHNVSVRGKSELSGYFMSVGLMDQKNLIINDNYKRYNVRLNLDTHITDWLKVGIQSFFTASDYSGVSPSLSDVMSLPPVCPVRNDEGTLIKQPYKSTINPLLQIEEEDSNKRNNLFANFYADVKIPWIEGLSYRMNFSQNLCDKKHYSFNPNGQNFQGIAYKMNSNQYQWTLDNIFTYKHSFGKHDINATFVYGTEKRTYESTTAGSKIFTNNILGYNNLSAGQADLQTANSSAWEESSLYNMFRLAYTFNNRYLFTGTVRRDGFSGFGEDNKFGVFPSAALGWRITEEDFMKNVNWLDNLKLRVSYGVNGNRTVGRYQTLSKISSGNGYLFGDGGTSEQIQWISSLANSDLKWETTKTFNIGADFSVLNNRIYGNVEYYVANTSNLLYNINIPTLNGFGSIPSNIGKMGNVGQELTVTGVPFKTKDFDWNVTFNFSRNRNKIKSILGIDADGDGKEDDLISSKIFMNKPYGVCYDFNIQGMWQVDDYNNGNIPDGFTYGVYKVEDINGDGEYKAADDRKILGYTDPAYRFSIQNNFRYKNLEFSFMINSIQGGNNRYLGQPGKNLRNPDNIYQNNLFNFDYWTPENPNARYRQIGSYPEAIGSDFSPYISRSFVRLQDATIAYNFPKRLLNKIKFSKIRVFVTGKNLLTFTDWDGWDPETGAGLTPSYPLLRSYTFGLNLEF